MNDSTFIERNMKEENEWLNDIAQNIGVPGNTEKAYTILKSVLHTIRDMLRLQEVFYFSSCLPNFIRGIYFEGFNPEKSSVIMYNQEFLNRFRTRMGPRNSFYFEHYLSEQLPEAVDRDDFLKKISAKIGPDIDVCPERALQSVLDVLYSRIMPAEKSDIKNLIQTDIPLLQA